MSKGVYRGNGVGIDTGKFWHATYNMAELPALMRRTFEMIEPAAKESFVGITTDNNVASGLYELKSTGISTGALVEAAMSFLNSLSLEQRAAALYSMDDYRRRLWCNAFMPYSPHGVLLEEMSGAIRQRALALFEASFSAKGYRDTRSVMRLNSLLGQLIGDRGRNLTEWMYWLSLFGDPSQGQPWGWQLAGHHLDLNVTVIGDQIIITPAFMGAEPRISDEVEGPFAGVSAFDEEQARGLALVRALSPEQRNKAILYPSMLTADLPEHLAGRFSGRIRGSAGRDNLVLPYEGIPASELSRGQRELLLMLIGAYAGRLPAGHDALKMAEIHAHLNETYFSWIGATELEKTPFYYKIHSPVVLIEFDHHAGILLDNPEPERFHVHTMVRTPNGNDYGKDLLRQHYERFEHTPHGHVARHPRMGAD